MRFHLKLVRTPIIQKSKNVTEVAEDMTIREGTLIQCWQGYKLVQLWKTAHRLPTDLRIYLQYDPAILLLEIHPKEIKTAMKFLLTHNC